MTRKEKIRFVAALALSVLFIIFSVLLLDAAFAEVFMMPSKMTETFYGFVLFAVVMASIALLIIGVGTLSVGALGAFLAFSFWRYEGKNVRITMKTFFAADIALIVLDGLSLVLLLL